MKKNKPDTPDSISESFQNSAKDNDLKEIQRSFEKLGARAKIRYRLMVERQDAARSLKLKEFEKQRENLIKVLSVEALTKRLREIHPELKPKFLNQQDRNEQKKFARLDAEHEVKAIEQTTLGRMDKKFLSDQQRLLQQEQSRSNRLTFNQRSRGGLSFQFNSNPGLKR